MHVDMHAIHEQLTREQAAEYLSVAPGTLGRWAAQGRGPRYARSGDRRGRCWYARRDLDAWLESRKVSPGHGAKT
jgi:hypothetical protein